MRTRYEPRKLMELAINVMRQSVNEPRTDDKASPTVGAVLYKPDGTVETAYRGELRYGDHAEYTLLERKNRDCKLDDAILFVTLEPCAPGSRHYPKLGCAERIVLARIKEVWIGIEDPDPTVDRKGIKYLQDSGIVVNMFDRDLQEIIKQENKEFIMQATSRAKDAEKLRPKKIVLSELEGVFANAYLENLSKDALNKYRVRSNIKEPVGSPEFNKLLLDQGFLNLNNDILAPTGFGFLLFGKRPRRVMHQAGLLALINYPDGETERREFDDALVLIPELVEIWLKEKLPYIIDRGQMQREQRTDLPFELIREGLVNALIHRDYDITGAKCQLEISTDTMIIKSPGQPPAPITIEHLQSLNAPMLSRNPPLHYVFSQMELAEEQGMGIKSMRSLTENLGLPLPKYSWDDPYLVLTLYRNLEAATRTLDPQILESLSKTEQEGWKWLVTQTRITSNDYARAMKLSYRTAVYHLKRFTDFKLIRREGSGPSTHYIVQGK